jgi:iron(III) transport system ATP-binding protein
VADRVVLARVHPSFNVPTGSKVYLHMNPFKCICIPEDKQYRQAA